MHKIKKLIFINIVFCLTFKIQTTQPPDFPQKKSVLLEKKPLNKKVKSKKSELEQVFVHAISRQ